MIWLLGLVLAGGLVSAMKLPLVKPVGGFEKADEFLLKSRKNLEVSRFHFYVAAKEGPLVLSHLFSISDSMYVYGMTPRLNCSSSRLVIFDHTVFEDQMAKTKNGSVKKSSTKSSRGGRKQPVKSLSWSVDPNTVVVESKCASVMISSTSVAETYGRILSLITTDLTTSITGFIGASIEAIDFENYAVHLYFAEDVTEAIISQTTFMLSAEDRLFMLNPSQNQVTLQLKPVQDLKHVWELRNHITGKLLFSTGNKETLNRMIDWSRPENLWDQIIVREGEFEKMRKTGLSFAVGVYQRNMFHTRINDHIDLVEMKGNKFMKFNMDGGFEHVLGFYFFHDASSKIEEMSMSSIIYHHESDGINKRLKKVMEMEAFNLAIEQFLLHHFMHNKPNPKALPIPKFMRYKAAQLIEVSVIKNLEDYLNIGLGSWARGGVTWTPGDMLILSVTEGALSKEVPYTIFYVARFLERDFPLVFLRIYQFLLSDPNAWWASCIKTITIVPKKLPGLGLSHLLDLTIVFHKDPLMIGWDVAKFLAEFMLTASSEVAISSGLIDNKTGKTVSISADKSNAFGDCMNHIVNHLFQLPGPSNVFRSDEDANAYVPSQKKVVDPALKQAFEGISVLEWESKYKRLGPPNLFFGHHFQKYLDLSKNGRSFGIVSEWIKEKGATRAFCYKLPRKRTTELLAAVGTFVIGCADIFGTAFLGCMFEFEATPSLTSEGYDPNQSIIFTLFLDEDSTPENQNAVFSMMGMAHDMPLNNIGRFLAEDFLDDHGGKRPLPCPWMVKIADDVGLSKLFTDYHNLTHFVGWMEPSILLKTTLLKVSDEIDHSFDGPVLYLAVSEKDVFEMLFTLETGQIHIPGKQLWEMVQKISFTAEEGVPEMLLLGYHLKPDADIRLFEEIMEARLLWIFMVRFNDLKLEKKMNVALRIGTKYETTLSSFAELETKAKEFPALQSGDQVVIWNSQVKLPTTGSYRAYHIQVDFEEFATRMLIRAIEFLCGTFGGSWKTEFLSVHLRPVKKDGQADVADYELIWTFQNNSKTTDLECITVLAKVLLLCGSLSPEYSIGTFNFKTKKFNSTKILEGLVDEYLTAIHGMMTLSIPEWLRRKQAAEAAEAICAMKARELAVVQKNLEQSKELVQSKIEEVEERCKENEILLQAADLTVQQKSLSLESADFQIKAAELQVREEEIRLKQAKEQVEQLKKNEEEQQKVVERLRKEEMLLDQILMTIAEVKPTVSINEDQTAALKDAVKSSRRRLPTLDF